MFNIPKSVKITEMKNMTDAVGKDGVVDNLYPLFVVFQYLRLIYIWQKDRKDNIPIILTESGPIADDISDDRTEKLFDLPNNLFYVSIFDEYVGRCNNTYSNENKLSSPTHVVPLNQRPGSSAKDLKMNSIKINCCQESSPPFSLIKRIRRRYYKTRLSIDNSSDAHDSCKGINSSAPHTSTKFPMYRLSPKMSLVNKNSCSMNVLRMFLMLCLKRYIFLVIPNNQGLFNKDYILQEEGLCDSYGGIAFGFDANRESKNSGSIDEVLGVETESSDDIFSGGPRSPFINLNVARVPLRRQVMRRNDFLNTLFVDDSLHNKDNTFISRHWETSRDNKEKVTQLISSSEPFPNFNIFSYYGKLGSGSTNPYPNSGNAK
ncbi:hypothetical protein MKX01_004213, partial [Papaver californicum]